MNKTVLQAFTREQRGNGVLMNKIAICFLSVLLTVSSYASEETKRENLEKLFVVMKVDSMMDTIYAQMNQMMQGMRKQLKVKPSEEEQEIFDKYNTKLITALKSYMGWEKIKEPMIEVYLKYYTEKEIQDMLVFYSSDTGRSVVQKMPALLSDSMLLSQKLMQDFMPQMRLTLQELQEELVIARGNVGAMTK